MSFTRSTTDLKVHQSLSDYPNVEDGLSAEELKEKFDAPAEQLQKDLNKLEEELEASSAASSIGAEKLDANDYSEGTVLDKLKKINEDVKNVVLNQIPNNTITQEKMESNYEQTIAKKDGTLQTGLNTEKLGGSTKQEIIDSAGAFSETRVISSEKEVGRDIYDWEDALKDEKQEISLDNGRFFMIKVTLLNTNYFSNNTANTNLLLYDAVLGIVIPLVGVETSEEGADFTEVPKLYKIIGTTPKLVFAFVGRGEKKLEIQTGITNASDFSNPGEPVSYEIRIDVTSFLAKI